MSEGSKTDFRLLVINPGSTSTKVAVFENEEICCQKNLFHSAEALEPFGKIREQFAFRKDMIESYLQEEGISLSGLDAIVGRGGLLRPIPGGTYRINQVMLEDLESGRFGEHASDLGAMIAHALADPLELPAYIVNPIVVDEMEEIARISGMPEIPRVSIFHALNQKAVAINYAKSMGRKYGDLRLIVVHLGGGISIGVHRNGRVVDVNNALNGEGPFSPERTGGLPVRSLVHLAVSGEYSLGFLEKKISGQGGLVAYLGTNDAREVVRRIEAGDEKSRLIYEAMAYQVAKEVGAAATVLEGQVDGIILTGGIAYDPLLTGYIRQRVEFLAPVTIMPGEKEMEALAEGGLRVLRGEEEALEY